MNRHLFATVTDSKGIIKWEWMHFTQLCESQVIEYCNQLATNDGLTDYTIKIEHS